MTSSLLQSFKMTRGKFVIPDQEIVKWFPGHMKKAVDRMQSKLKDVDCIIEIHDSRIPFSGRNPRFRDVIALRPHVLVLNKIDLADTSKHNEIEKKLHKQGVDKVLFTNCLQYQSDVVRHQLIPTIMEMISSRPRFMRQELNEYNVMVIGVPNVGKSTFINSFRRTHTTKKRKAAHVGAIAGITRNVASRIKVSFNPPIFLIDTPGILTPTIPDVETGMRLASCSCFPDYLVGEEMIADYLLYWLNKRSRFQYVEKFNLNGPTDDILELLVHIAKQQSKYIKMRSPGTKNEYIVKPDFTYAAQHVIRTFRSGELGQFMLDDDKIKEL